MVINKDSDKSYTVKIRDGNLDIFDYDDILELIGMIVKNLAKFDIGGGLYRFNIYSNLAYGLIIDIDCEDGAEEEIEAKVSFHLDCMFLEEVDYFYIKDLGIRDRIIYYWNNKFYLEFDGDWIEGRNIVYGEDVTKIIDKGIIVRL